MRDDDLAGLMRRIESYIEPDTNSGCWLWSGCACPNRSGIMYGSVRRGAKMVRAHRLSYELKYGIPPPGMVVRHKCDVSLCVNPDHLVIGTQTQNMHDCYNRGRARHVRGEAHGCAKLKTSEVMEIRRLISLGEAPADIARSMGINRTFVISACQGWRDLDEQTIALGYGRALERRKEAIHRPMTGKFSYTDEARGE